jgi:DNA-binding response OmpR family regulator
MVRHNSVDFRLIDAMLDDELGHEAFSLHVADSVDDARKDNHDWNPDILVLDLSLADTVGLDALSKIQAVASTLRIIVLTGNQDQDMAL